MVPSAPGSDGAIPRPESPQVARQVLAPDMTAGKDLADSLRSRSFVSPSETVEGSFLFPSPFSDGVKGGLQFSSVWLAAQQNQPWRCSLRRFFGSLRHTYEQSTTDIGIPSGLLDLVAATVTFRQVCLAAAGGMLWMIGTPSFLGTNLLRILMPDVKIFRLQSDVGAMFVAAHPDLPKEIWCASLSASLMRLLSQRPGPLPGGLLVEHPLFATQAR